MINKWPIICSVTQLRENRHFNTCRTHTCLIENNLFEIALTEAMMSKLQFWE